MSIEARRTLAALAAGMALGAAMAAGNALLLYTGQGFLRAAGLLVSSTIMALAAGVWAGAPEGGHAGGGAAVESRGRWLLMIAALFIGGAFAAFWFGRPDLRDAAAGGALAVLLVLGFPAYSAGALLVALHARERAGLKPRESGSAAAAAVAGAAFGVLLATTILIQNLEAYGIFYAGAALLTLASVLEWRPAGDHAGATDMTDHVAIITGVGSAGQVGYAVAARFLAAGARVVVTGRSSEVEALARSLGDEDAVVGVQADLLVEDDVARIMTAARQHFGRADSLVNVAGGLSVTGSISETTPEEWQLELQRNAETALRVCQAALPLLRESRGAIVNFASPAGLRAVKELGAYSAAKAAVIALTRAIALEEKGHGVRANVIAPGMVDTAENRQAAGDDAAYVTRDEIASVALFLAGPDARGISGETISVLGPGLR
jgi:NAD(P)-dependent dehydrogenase (short-subunit alcohol dehydrogenase family)